MDNKNVFIAIALSMSVLLFWAAFFDSPKPVKQNINNSSLLDYKIQIFNKLCS